MSDVEKKISELWGKQIKKECPELTNLEGILNHLSLRNQLKNMFAKTKAGDLMGNVSLVDGHIESKSELNEIMKDIEGYEGIYAITENGRVWSHNKKIFLKPREHTNGYTRVMLFNNGKRKDFYIHRLVAMTFLPNPNNKPEIDHINSNRADNRLSNLRWVTKAENRNTEHHIKTLSESLKNGKTQAGANNGNAKAIIQCDKNGRFIRKWDYIGQAAKVLNLNSDCISMCCKGKIKQTKGYCFRYFKESEVDVNGNAG